MAEMKEITIRVAYHSHEYLTEVLKEIAENTVPGEATAGSGCSHGQNYGFIIRDKEVKPEAEKPA